MQDHGFDCGKCAGVCTEGAANMVSCHSCATAKKSCKHLICCTHIG